MTVASSSTTAFRDAERYWKSRSSPPDLSNAFSPSPVFWSANETRIWKATHASSPPPQRVRRLDANGAIAFEDFPGLVYLPAFLAPAVQRELVKGALRTAAVSPPNTTSLDPHFELPSEGIWEATRLGAARRVQRRDGRSGRCEECKEQSLEAREVLRKLRWCTVGDIYDWTRKIYLYDRPSPPVPSCISRVCLDAVRSINWRSVFGRSGEWDSWHDSYQAEAGLLNFYQPRDMLTAHVDQAEGDATSPLVSISIGLSAIFLIGGRSKDVKPLPLLLRSGDVVIMAGPSRQAYHGVPLVLDEPSPLLPIEEDEEWEQHGFAEYMRTTRVNLNVRQVRAR